MDATPSELAYRLGRVERDTENLEQNKADKDMVKAIADEVKSLRKVLITFALTVAGSAVLICGTILETALHAHGG